MRGLPKAQNRGRRIHAGLWHVCDHAGGAYVPTAFVGMYATQGRYNVRVSKLKHYYGLNHLVLAGGHDLGWGRVLRR